MEWENKNSIPEKIYPSAPGPTSQSLVNLANQTLSGGLADNEFGLLTKNSITRSLLSGPDCNMNTNTDAQVASSPKGVERSGQINQRLRNIDFQSMHRSPSKAEVDGHDKTGTKPAKTSDMDAAPRVCELHTPDEGGVDPVLSRTFDPASTVNAKVEVSNELLLTSAKSALATALGHELKSTLGVALAGPSSRPTSGQVPLQSQHQQSMGCQNDAAVVVAVSGSKRHFVVRVENEMDGQDLANWVCLDSNSNLALRRDVTSTEIKLNYDQLITKSPPPPLPLTSSNDAGNKQENERTGYNINSNNTGSTPFAVLKSSVISLSNGSEKDGSGEVSLTREELLNNRASHEAAGVGLRILAMQSVSQNESLMPENTFPSTALPGTVKYADVNAHERRDAFPISESSMERDEVQDMDTDDARGTPLESSHDDTKQTPTSTISLRSVLVSSDAESTVEKMQVGTGNPNNNSEIPPTHGSSKQIVPTLALISAADNKVIFIATTTNATTTCNSGTVGSITSRGNSQQPQQQQLKQLTATTTSSAHVVQFSRPLPKPIPSKSCHKSMKSFSPPPLPVGVARKPSTSTFNLSPSCSPDRRPYAQSTGNFQARSYSPKLNNSISAKQTSIVVSRDTGLLSPPLSAGTKGGRENGDSPMKPCGTNVNSAIPNCTSDVRRPRGGAHQNQTGPLSLNRPTLAYKAAGNTHKNLEDSDIDSDMDTSESTSSISTDISAGTARPPLAGNSAVVQDLKDIAKVIATSTSAKASASRRGIIAQQQENFQQQPPPQQLSSSVRNESLTAVTTSSSPISPLPFLASSSPQSTSSSGVVLTTATSFDARTATSLPMSPPPSSSSSSSSAAATTTSTVSSQAPGLSGVDTGRRLRVRNQRKFLPEKTRHKRQTLQDMTRPLKQWLYKHRENPYPSKGEKMELVKISEMSLTQVSNWFANARRRLKNTVKGEDVSWAKRIKVYNKFAEGNAELFSIPSSDEGEWDSDSDIASERQDHRPQSEPIRCQSTTPSPAPTLTSSLSDTALTSPAPTQSAMTSPSGTTRSSPALEDNHAGYHKYKHSILQRYLQDASQQALIPDDDMMTSRSRHRHLSSSTGSHDFEYLSTSSVSSPSHETHHDAFDDFSEEFETIAIRRRMSENPPVFPRKDPERMKLWVSRISRQTPDGKPWVPTQFDKVCSAHFLPSDFNFGLDHKTLSSSAVPSVFPHYPALKQCQPVRKRPSPKKRGPPSSSTMSSCESVPTKVSFLDHNYCCPSVEADLERTKKKLANVESKLRDKTQDLKNVNAKLKRRESRISNLLEDISKQRLLHDEEVSLLKDNFSEETFTLIENELQAQGNSKQGHRYSDDLKAFAVTLHFYSAAANEYVRKYLHLPHPDSIRRWASSNSVQPGFLASVVEYLKSKCLLEQDMKDVAIMFDSMSIRKEMVYDKKLQTYAGFINYGYIQTAAADTLATEALVLLVVGLKKSFKQPIGYFLIDKISASQQAQIIRHGVSLMTDAGFNVHAVVCDGAYANQSTAQQLGCRMTEPNMVTSFQHPSDPLRKVNFVLDAAHLLKNIRNCLADLRVLKCGQQEIRWQYIVELHKLQSSNTLYLANKLRGMHIDFAKDKMKVSLASQTLSSSVASAIDYLRDVVKLPQFSGSEATCQFIRWFDSIFDLTNSSSCLAKGLKSPLNRSNFAAKSRMVQDGCAYIRGLTDVQGKSLLSGKRKTGFLSFIVTMTSIITIAEKLLFSSGYKFFLTYRLSQDHLETLFSKIRRRGGCNNNPNALQFQWALRALLLRNGVAASQRANCSTLPEVNNTLFADSTSEDSAPLPLPNEGQASASNASHDPEFSEMPMSPGVYHDHVLHYIAGFICRKMARKIRCSECQSFLTDKDKLGTAAVFTRSIDNGGLMYASRDTLRVVKAADRSLRRLLVTAREGPLASVSPVTTRLVTIEVLESLGSSVFLELGKHCMERHCIETEDDHVSQIIKEICGLFCNIILTHHGRLYNERFVHKNRGSERHKLSKTILFLHI